MLKGIDPILSPDLLRALAQMGHGDELVLADAHFPGHRFGENRVMRADGLEITDLLAGIMPLFELDTYEAPLVMMSAVPGDELDPSVEAEYMGVIHQYAPDIGNPIRLERSAFYERSAQSFLCLMTGSTAKYGNLILKKGVTPCP